MIGPSSTVGAGPAPGPGAGGVDAATAGSGAASPALPGAASGASSNPSANQASSSGGRAPAGLGGPQASGLSGAGPVVVAVPESEPPALTQAQMTVRLLTGGVGLVGGPGLAPDAPATADALQAAANPAPVSVLLVQAVLLERMTAVTAELQSALHSAQASLRLALDAFLSAPSLQALQDLLQALARLARLADGVGTGGPALPALGEGLAALAATIGRLAAPAQRELLMRFEAEAQAAFQAWRRSPNPATFTIAHQAFALLAHLRDALAAAGLALEPSAPVPPPFGQAGGGLAALPQADPGRGSGAAGSGVAADGSPAPGAGPRPAAAPGASGTAPVPAAASTPGAAGAPAAGAQVASEGAGEPSAGLPPAHTAAHVQATVRSQVGEAPAIGAPGVDPAAAFGAAAARPMPAVDGAAMAQAVAQVQAQLQSALLSLQAHPIPGIAEFAAARAALEELERMRAWAAAQGKPLPPFRLDWLSPPNAWYLLNPESSPDRSLTPQEARTLLALEQACREALGRRAGASARRRGAAVDPEAQRAFEALEIYRAHLAAIGRGVPAMPADLWRAVRVPRRG